jgi:hypothetical protein
MELSPVARYTPPSYPTHDVLAAHPELLQALPLRWRTNPAVLTALSAVCLLLGHAARAEEATVEEVLTFTPATETVTQVVPIRPQVTTIRLTLGDQRPVAPLFAHGEGRGSFGCIAVNPPVVLSEAEALQIVREEAKRFGITFPERHEIPGVLPPVRRFTTQAEVAPAPVKRPLKLDGWNAQRKIGFTFVSEDEYADWGDALLGVGGSYIFSTAYSINTRDAALALRTRLDMVEPEGKVGVFYDPMEHQQPALLSMSISYLTAIGPDGKPVPSPPPPTVRSAFVPYTFFRKLGAYVTANFDEKTVRIEKGGTLIDLRVGKALAVVNGKRVVLPYLVTERGGLPYLPVGAVARLLGAGVAWHARTATVAVREKTGAQWLTSTVTVMPHDMDGVNSNVPFAFDDADSTKEHSREALRAQVRDFINWLKGQGVL